MSFTSGLTTAQLLELVALGEAGNPPANTAAFVDGIFTDLFGTDPGNSKFVKHLVKELAHHKITAADAVAHVANHGTAVEKAALLAEINADLPPPPPAPYTLTVGQDTIAGSGGNNVFNAPLAGIFGNQPTLSDGDSLTDTGASNVLNAAFDGTDTVTGLTIQGIQTWNISDNLPPPSAIGGSSSSSSAGTIDLTGTATSISGLTTLNFNDNSTTGSLLVGDNAEPVQEPNGANGFAINVSNAVGTGTNGVDVDIAAGAFTGHDTISVSADVVGGFPESNGSYILPDPILNTTNDADDYDPNWDGYLADAFAIAAGASAGPNGPVGFATWDVRSDGAKAVGTENILALGGEGSSSATTLNLTDDGSNTILFATYLSDSTLGDWANLKTINLGGTSGFVTITGAEVCAVSGEGGGLLTDDTSALTTIIGGSGNSFYDLTSLTAAAATAAGSSFEGGTSLKGNSEIAFNNSVFTDGAPVNISHIQVLDDASSSQGGFINMSDFAGLSGLNVAYTLLQGGEVPKGFELLQLLGPNGGTTACLESNLTIENSSQNFAINMGDMSDACYNITISGLGWPASTPSTLDVWVPDDGVCLPCGLTASNVPDFTIDNYTTTNIFMPYEDDYVVLGSCSGFTDYAIPEQNAITVNFYDNTADTGGSPPGSPDNLVLGVTNFETCLTPDNIGSSTVSIFATVVPGAGPLETVINDFGAGSFEIGATNVTNLNAQSTSHLIMDLPGTNTAEGIDVNGSAMGQNLLQGTSGPVTLDFNGHWDGCAYETAIPNNVGNDTLTGGIGLNGVANCDGNTGDNYFPEGGNDIVNISHATAAEVSSAGLSCAPQSTVWFGFYDVSDSGDYLGPCFNSGVGQTYEQAITDVVNNCETFVDGYGSSTLAVNGFKFGPTGDTINFAVSSWANCGPILGLTQSDGESCVTPNCPTTYVTATTPGVQLNGGPADVIVDAIGSYANAKSLLAGLLQHGVGDIVLNGSGVQNGTEVDILVAYQTATAGKINIADVTLDNCSGSTQWDTSCFTKANGSSISVHDLISIVGTAGGSAAELSNLNAHNIAFLA